MSALEDHFLGHQPGVEYAREDLEARPSELQMTCGELSNELVHELEQ
eukprot:CAMPEP_0204047552 /NCGR_PEP_ID=MMETSP0360-20130528/113505_1 /ASSEMBLY_ACC=CAM_ASM_000342 /TAXON_ID=268821 /ORGANISM="Scrippsiella Hangoei, Strain SHTV-5" /LENGTH=46 /DNA_ID= /DNA_START= /DNA_END= /DNA_ORIENTATION=